MSHTRAFSASEQIMPVTRTLTGSVPEAMRQEIVALLFRVASMSNGRLSANQIHRTSLQSVGITPAGNPMAGVQQAVGRSINTVSWESVYDLLTAMWPEFVRVDLEGEYRDGVNRILAKYGSAWDMNESGNLIRVVPVVALQQIAVAINELRDSRFDAAQGIFANALGALNRIPREDRDLCANAFDAMEAVAKVALGLPNETFGQVMTQARQRGIAHHFVLNMLDDLNSMANREWRHGTQFTVSPTEAEFVLMACVSGILLFARHKPQ